MNFRPRQRRDEISLDLTPLIDVVFLLLLFFMLTTTFVGTTRLKIDLPEAKAGIQTERKEPWVIEIDAQGHYALNGERVEVEQLAARLRAIPGQTEETSVLVRADGKATYQAVVRALDAARSAGLTHVGLVTIPAAR